MCFAELRALTNRKAVRESGLGLNPMELSDLYEHLWNVGVLLQSSENAMSIYHADYRPWPRLHAGDAVSEAFYARLERNKIPDMAELNLFSQCKDIVRYSQVNLSCHVLLSISA